MLIYDRILEPGEIQQLADGVRPSIAPVESIDKLTPDSETVWRWEGDGTLASPNHHDFYWASEDEVISLGARNEPVMDGFYVPGTEPNYMRTDVFLGINQKKEIVWKFSLSEHVEELCKLAGYPVPIPYMRKTTDGKFMP